MKEKILIYQLFPRLFGNTSTSLKKNGSIEENGCGRFIDINDNALDSLKAMGVNTIWCMGVIRHATSTNRPYFGLYSDNPLIVKGRAGSPYAIRDYYDVNADYASDPAKRHKEFEELISRIHNKGMKIIIDFVPNHVARNYHSGFMDDDHTSLGDNDDNTKAFSPKNDFYYIPDETFVIPDEARAYCREAGLLGDAGTYLEVPAKASGNDCFSSKPSVNDWYEAIKINYGVDYPGGKEEHFEPRPAVWDKMLHILKYWLSKGVDGFRCDMAEMVPLAFWQYASSRIRMEYPNAVFIAEIYKPELYKDYLKGGFDFLYDKVGLYDCLRSVILEDADCFDICRAWQSLDGIDAHMLRFMENHDEQRIASSFFAGDPGKGIPAVAVAALMHQGPFLIYNGQETGEKAEGVSGFSGNDGRSSIFDYGIMPELNKWYNYGLCNGGGLSSEQQELRDTYSRIMNIAAHHPAISRGAFYDLMWMNQANTEVDMRRLYAFLRREKEKLLLVAANFSGEHQQGRIQIGGHAWEYLELPMHKEFMANDILNDGPEFISSPFKAAGQGFEIFVPAYGASAYEIRFLND